MVLLFFFIIQPKRIIIVIFEILRAVTVTSIGHIGLIGHENGLIWVQRVMIGRERVIVFLKESRFFRIVSRLFRTSRVMSRAFIKMTIRTVKTGGLVSVPVRNRFEVIRRKRLRCRSRALIIELTQDFLILF